MFVIASQSLSSDTIKSLLQINKVHVERLLMCFSLMQDDSKTSDLSLAFLCLGIIHFAIYHLRFYLHPDSFQYDLEDDLLAYETKILQI